MKYIITESKLQNVISSYLDRKYGEILGYNMGNRVRFGDLNGNLIMTKHKTGWSYSPYEVSDNILDDIVDYFSLDYDDDNKQYVVDWLKSKKELKRFFD